MRGPREATREDEMATRHLIIGAGPAGINAIETLRAIDSDCEIALICDEPAYARMVLPYYLEGKIEERAVMTGDEEWFSERGVTTHLGVRVTAVDPGSNQLALDDGARLGYDRLLVATGSRAARPPIDGLDGSGIVNLWTLADAKHFLAEPRPHTVSSARVSSRLRSSMRSPRAVIASPFSRSRIECCPTCSTRRAPR